MASCRRIQIRVFVYLLLLSWSLSGARSWGGEPLTLEQGIQMTLANNASLQASQHSVRAAEQGVREARGNFLPRIDLSESFIRTNGPGEVFWTELSQERFSLAEFSMTDPNDPDPLSNYRTSLSLVQPIYAGGKIRTGYQISKLQRDAAESLNERAKQEVIREFTAAYYDALLADRFVRAAELAKTSVQAHVKMAGDLMDQGVVLRSDLLRARVHLSEVEAMLTTADNQRKLAEANLNRIMGTEQDREYELLEQDDVEQIRLEEIEALIQEAKLSRPDLMGLTLMAETAEKEVALARASSLPSLNFVARYDRNDQDFIGDDGEYWTVMAVANLNLFEGFSSKARMQKAKFSGARMASLVTHAVQGIELEVRRAYLNVKEARARLEIARRAEAEAEESMRIIEDRYGSGLTRITDLLDTETALTRARTNRAKARFDLNIARTDLDLAVGRLSPR